MAQVITAAHSVVLSSASSDQKAALVNTIKQRSKGKKVLAIGDGANDAKMLAQADIGVSISTNGRNLLSEFADYHVPTFEHLRRLLFWHGSPFG